MADLDERMKMLVMNNGEEDVNGDTFAERAESYYEKRPQHWPNIIIIIIILLIIIVDTLLKSRPWIKKSILTQTPRVPSLTNNLS